MPPSVSSSLSLCLDWGRSGLTVETKPGLLVVVRLWQTFFSTSMGAQVPVIVEKPLATCGCRKFQLDPLGDHLNTCTSHSGAKKTHDWMVAQIADLFHTTHKVKTQKVIKSRGQHCGDIKLAGYLVNEAGPVPLVLDLRIDHDHFGSSSDPSLNGNLHYPNNIDRSLNETVDDKIRKYRADYNTNPPIDLCDLLTFKIYMVQPTRLYNLLCRTRVKSSVVRGPGPVERRCSPQSLPESAPRRPPTHTSDSVPINVHPTPTSLQFRVLYTYLRIHLYMLGSYHS
jgi:hypothetical protein